MEFNAGLVLGPLNGPQRLQLRRLLGQVAGVKILAQAFSLSQVTPLIEAHQANTLLLSGQQDFRALGPLPACVRLCVWLHGSCPVSAPPGLKLVALPCPQDLEEVQTEDPFFLALCSAFGALGKGFTPFFSILSKDSHPEEVASHGPGTGTFQMLAIGASTGGPDAIASLLQPMSGRLPVPAVITQHIGAGFSAALAQSLSQRCKLPVYEASDGQMLKAGHVYLAPADRHLLVQQRQGRLLILLDDGPAENFCKPSVDAMLRSLSCVAGVRTLAIILTGMGQDGLKGARLLHGQGGVILAQDQASSAVWGMPGAVAQAGLCKAMLPPPALAQKALRLLETKA